MVWMQKAVEAAKSILSIPAHPSTQQIDNYYEVQNRLWRRNILFFFKINTGMACGLCQHGAKIYENQTVRGRDNVLLCHVLLLLSLLFSTPITIIIIV